MIFSWIELIVFVFLMQITAWALYPSDYARGMMLRNEGDHSESIAYFKDFLAKRPFHRGATLALVDAYEGAGKPEEALRWLKELYRHRRGDGETGERVMALMRDCGLDQEAVAFRWELLADLKKKTVDSEESRSKLLLKALRESTVDQDDETSMLALAELVEMKSGGEAFRAELLRLLLQRRQLGKAVGILKEAVAITPSDMELRRTLFRVHQLRNDLESAVAVLTEAMTVEPEDVGVLSDRAGIYVKQEQWGPAETDFRHLMKLEPAEPSWVRELGHALIKAGKVEEGIVYYDKLISQKPEDQERWWNVIYTYSDLKDFGKAAGRLEAYLLRFPYDGDATQMLVNAYMNLGRIDQATQVLERRLRRARGDIPSRHSLVELLRADERYEETVPHYLIMIELEPRDRDHRLDLAYVYATLGRKREAAETFEAHIRLFPDDSKSIDKLVELLQAIGENKRAIEILYRHFETDKPAGGAKP